ncbi:putative endo-beta-1 4-glucanase D [Colletotrichum gloeosporioides]|uniref:lytic cellulose monooxygenase (C4-dehydrogenating) n=1 Tax=Colletotrichum gloeosporioides TaxID=474922 RepID=A0A8H4C6Z3_COLGL|nr:putative endo-beta-1 4-glucanase D [Colletotrichum gloeosporioides]KAF3798312.1 putative endo-beta-1 4-glucanase D [Colletotrichum gloeosporioides]
MKTFTATLALLSSASSARLPPSNSPVTDVASNDLRCNVGGATGVAGVCEVPSRQQGLGREADERGCEKPAIGGNHFGPVMLYLSKVADGPTDFFKIGAYGHNSAAADATWGTDILSENCGRFDVTIPPALEAGDYLRRAEAIALHAASQAGGAQFFVTCYSLAEAARRRLASGSGAYSAADPGIQVDIWGGGCSKYTTPGPAVAYV